MTFQFISAEKQREANNYWASREHKKWVCEFFLGSKFNRKEATCYVSARTKDGALKTGILQAKMFGNTWVDKAMQSVRLATADDLGCVVTAEVPS